MNILFQYYYYTTRFFERPYTATRFSFIGSRFSDKKYKCLSFTSDKNLSLESVRLPEIESMIFGTLLGDASITKKHNPRHNHSIKWEQSEAHKEYLFHCYEIVAIFVNSPPKIRHIKGGGAKDRNSYRFWTVSLPIFSQFYHMFYTNNGKKAVPTDDLLEEYLDEGALAFWFMDDGNRNMTSSYSFSTHSFSYEDNLRLVAYFQKRFSLHPVIRMDKGMCRLDILSKEVVLFTNLIQPYIIPSMRYKLISRAS